MPSPVAIVCSDLHLSQKPPIARSAEKDWFAAMERQLCQLRKVQEDLSKKNGQLVPVLCAGDIFDRWNAPAELINFAIDKLPAMYAIPGQHDLPLHNYEDIEKSAYWTLEQAGAITHLEPNKLHIIEGLAVRSFPWGYPPEPFGWKGKTGDPKYLALAGDRVYLALVHKYCWRGRHSYPGAPKENSIAAYQDALEGYHVAVFGDNHKGFFGNAGKCRVVNCGGFFRRHANEQENRPFVSVVLSNGFVSRTYLDCSEDVFLDIPNALQQMDQVFDFSGFLGELTSASSNSLDFVQAVGQFLLENKTCQHVKKIIMEVLDNAEKK